MINKEYFKNKKIVIAGLARSGLACANLLFDLGSKVSVTDNQDNPITQSNARQVKSKEIKIEIGEHTRGFIEGNHLLTLSPGVPKEALPVIWAQELNIPIISEIELAWRLCSGTVIAITGTNGKTTVTTLIGKILEAAGKRSFTLGNIGQPFSCQVSNIAENDFISLEVSSFQLEWIDTFKPKIAVVLNLSRNHLDRYASMEDYLTAKKRIFKNQDQSDYLVLNYDHPAIRVLAKESRAKVLYFRQEAGFNPNQSAALSVASILGIDRKIVLNVFKEFKGVEHRMEEVAQVGGVKFINDSKSTTIDATIWALNNLDCPVVLIAGGREKGNDYSQILPLVRRKVKSAILIGEAKERIKAVFNGAISIDQAATLDEAVKKSFTVALPGECVLFSPMCKSFDMFLNYEERGKSFKNIVYGLAGFKS
ncbi:MAG: UDP-N-acetylmuramoyl-L-alanine--D-glutamate ligase [Candidatus Omnitrophica bacterium]|nr:UDP-N-acetylmuramoyl-L-alanine--D-glutamate ligase [Candidatus Omnitrophota bacterium]